MFQSFMEILTASQILWNDTVTITDEQTKIQAVDIDPDSSNLQALTLWAHQKCGHLGEKATYRLFLEAWL